MSFSPAEKDIKSLISVVRRSLTCPPPANPGDTDASMPDPTACLWRAVLRRLPHELEYVYPDNVVDENLRCPVCLGWPTNPVVLGCPAGHLLCRSCTSSLRERKCPLDRQPFTASSPAEEHIRARLDRLQVRCPYAAAGCGWIGDRGHVLDHCRGSCDEALEECRQCGAYIRRRERAGHTHAFEKGACVRYVGQGGDRGVGEVVRTDAVSDTVVVRFGKKTSRCSRSELVQCSESDEGSTRVCGSTDTPDIERRQEQINSVLDVYEQAERLNTCFLVDCTGSMRSHIRAVKEQIFCIVREMSLRLPSMQLHLAFIGYRDHGDSDRFEACPFTTSVESFRDFVSAVGAYGCGGDVPEDVLGGLEQALNLEWGIGGAATRVLIHIGDAPCHGTRYQDPAVFRHRDNYPNGDPLGLQASDLLRSLQGKNVQYIFGRINQTTDKMICLFDEEAGGGFIQTREMRDTRMVADAVTSSLHASVATTVSTLSSERQAPSRVQTSEEIPCWGEISAVSVRVHHCTLVQNIGELQKGAPACATKQFWMNSASVQLAHLPFSQGETRAARYALVDGSHQAIAKHIKSTSGDGDREVDADDFDEEDEDLAGLDELLTLSEVSAVATFLANSFSAGLEHGPKICFLESQAAAPFDGSKPFNLEPALPADEFRRFSNNIGWWEPDADDVLMRFMRWTYEATEGYMMVVDLQGVRTEDGFVLTDPCILCSDVTRFGSGNLGPRAMERCLTSLAARLDKPAEAAPIFQEVFPSPSVPVPQVITVPLPLSSYDASTPYVPDRLRWGGTTTSPVVEEFAAASTTTVPGSTGVMSKAVSALSSAFGKAGMMPAKSPPSANSRVSGPREVPGLAVDSVIADLLLPSGGTVRTSDARLPSDQSLRLLLAAARSTILSQPALLEIEAPINILGDIHGQFADLLRYFDMSNIEKSNYLFLGDYVDRGRQSLEVMTLLFALKVKRPENVFLLRGNHECASITRIYGFYDECKRRFSIKMWKLFCDVFNCLPLAAVIDEKIFCCHGGPSPELGHLDSVRRIQRPIDVPDCGLVCDLLWADPDKDIVGWAENDRGVSFTFGPDAAASFLAQHDLDLIVRAHQVVEDGYEFFANRRLVTLFSAVNYCGEFDNNGALMEVKDGLECSFKLVRSRQSGE